MKYSGAHRPGFAIEFEHAAAGEAGQIGGEVVSSGGPDRPVHEIRARIVCVSIGVKKIADRKSSNCQGDAVNVALAGNLVRAVFDRFLLAAQTKSLAEKITLRADAGKFGSGFLGFAITETSKTEGFGDAETLRQFGIEIDLAAFPELAADEGCCGPGFTHHTAARQAGRAGIGCTECGIALRQERCLAVNAPAVHVRRLSSACGAHGIEPVVQSQLEEMNFRIDVECRRQGVGLRT